MRKLHRGFTLVEVLGALAVASMMAVGVAAMIGDSLEDTKGEQAALYQAQVAEAASKYINDGTNYAALLTATGASTPAVINLATLKAARHLSQNFQGTNAYGQMPCVLVLQPAPGRLDALVVTEGGTELPSKMAARIAASAGPGGGYIPFNNSTVAQGAFNSWSVPLVNYITANCSGTAANANHLASALFFDGPGQLSREFVYRNARPGQPELNQMTTPLNMRARAVEGTSDALCIVGDASTYGRIAADANGMLLSCQVGVWKGTSNHWKDPVASFAALPLTGNAIGDVRLTIDTGRAFSWNGSAWMALAVDQNGNFNVPQRVTANNVLVNQIVTHRSACSPDGLLGRDADGLLMSCQRGIWRKFIDSEVTTVVYNQYRKTTPATGDIDMMIDLTALPGSRPLYITGDPCCVSLDDNQSVIRIEYYDAVGTFLGYAGGCAAQSEAAMGQVSSATPMATLKIPENATRVRLYMHAVGHAGNMTEGTLTIFNSR
ncbi:shufflon system plasmid conjugative transfer pilus tip adhesin PilV [Noviherbaspirillum saxi]|uniref:Shufflon system plasmid conjugative transfer pilus tip adhesin PilV n=1 Tax=Noviherbaspirillum saxi TaxID=2320863 RepID=A0A3A3FK80_9BURK|nr:shufflon system plasmid conjugative transfer pilus tip adhesin PilV [Noviherbaspirillum saxi]RJF92788.1 shufflon system plasmid conjugative transfer pilus tip adhesin PilV [Noviherbaspirillum saxi]